MNKSTWKSVIKDIKKRDKFGIKKYKIPLNTTTKKDMLVEHYEELLDAIVYIKTLILQREQNANIPDHVQYTYDKEQEKKKTRVCKKSYGKLSNNERT